ncbi:hypothetical protein BDB00DRAFT_823167 [Zychaea mexicana]|uniref:uncharacterized protein n=1 Tax=Zychaea mexicana TaxID=64656 RepID=UPI0022FEA792|nr:uncharacterized protein BDB00DRAFT_823167 [Zychaea mexicana]KAI9493464.1 hypothetical protein BDB00DRAFT_823167 [Zychaea mexicana]
MEVARKAKGASVQLQFYEQFNTIACFEPICDPLLSELHDQQADLSLQARDLSLLIGQLQQYQQDHLGVHSTRPNNAPLRIPAKLFKFDENQALTTDSPVYFILRAAYTYRIKHNWRKFDFGPSKKSKNADLIKGIREELQQAGLIISATIGLSDTVPDSARKTIKSLAKKIHLQVLDDASEATHILHGPLHEYEVGEEEWFRTLEKRDRNVLVHWWYFPDSYDSWLPQTDQFADPEEAPEHHGAWNIATRWLQDSVKYNELVNEEDYEDVDGEEDQEEEELEEAEEEEELPDATTADVRQRSESISESKLKASVPSSSTLVKTELSSSKQQQETQPPPPSQQQPASISTCTSTATSPQQQVRQPLQHLDYVEVTVAPPVPVLNPESQPAVRIRDIEKDRPQLGSRQRKNEFEPYSNGDATNISQYTKEFMENPAKSDVSLMDLDKPEDIEDVESSDDDKTFTGPEWFSLSDIADREKVALPEYFKSQDKRGEKGANEYKKYRNFMVQTYRKNPGYYLTFSACKDALKIDMLAIVRIHTFLEQAGLINHLVDPRRRLFDPYIDSEPEAQISQPGTQRDFSVNEPDIQFLRNLIYEEIPKNSKESAWDVEVYDDLNADGRSVFSCTNCHGDCSETRYHSLKYKGIHVCTNCFLDGRFTAATCKGEFLRVDKGDREVPEDTWSEEELLRLLEAVDKNDDDWLAISEHVATRTKEQCITQFLQLPINDEFLTAKLSNKELEELPFGEQPNPVMTLIAFLSSHINPGIGSSAAKSALKELMKKDSEEEQANGSANKEDRMDVDSQSDDDDDDMDDDDDEEEEEAKTAFSRKKMKKATVAALESAIDHAKKLASYEHEEIQHWTRLAVKTLVDKLMIKVQQYDEQEVFLENELKELEKQGNTLLTSLEALSKQYPPGNRALYAAAKMTNSNPAITIPPTSTTVAATSGPPESTAGSIIAPATSATSPTTTTPTTTTPTTQH